MKYYNLYEKEAYYNYEKELMYNSYGLLDGNITIDYKRGLTPLQLKKIRDNRRTLEVIKMNGSSRRSVDPAISRLDMQTKNNQNTTKYIGEFSYGIKEGDHITFYPDGKIASIINYKKGLADGEAIWYHHNGNIAIKRYFKNGYQYGIYTEWYENGQIRVIYKLKLKNNLPSLEPKSNDLDPSYPYFTDFNNYSILLGNRDSESSYRVGNSQYFYENGELYCQLEFKNGTLKADVNLFYSNGNKMLFASSNKENAKLIFAQPSCDTCGNLKDAIYRTLITSKVFGFENGITTKWYTNENINYQVRDFFNISKTEYQFGKNVNVKEGKFKYEAHYYKNGNLMSEKWYDSIGDIVRQNTSSKATEYRNHKSKLYDKWAKERIAYLEENIKNKNISNNINGVIEIPIIKEGKMNFILIKLGNKEYKFLIDSGASDMVLSSSVENELISRGKIRANDYTGVREYQIANGQILQFKTATLKTIEINNNIFSSIDVAIGDKNTSLLLGMSFLDKFKWRINENVLELEAK
tara:strand:+ start:55 stop:1623 length:1569 start_codon:yes stop_codon:yes gene_type:complete